MDPHAKYSWNFTFKQVVEFTRHDAEIMLDLDGDRSQKVIGHFPDNDAAQAAAVAFCEQLSEKIKALVKSETSNLKHAKA